MSRQGILLSIVLAAAAIFSHTRLYQPLARAAATDFAKFPREFSGWEVIAEYPPGQREIEMLETNNILTRVYRDTNNREATLVLVYDPSGNRKMAHPQEVCLRGDGLQTVSKSKGAIAGGIEAERLLMERGEQRTLYYYWYKAGAAQSGSYMDVQIRLALAALSGKTSGTALVRLSTVVKTEESQSDELLRAFASDLMPALEQHLP